MSIRVFPVAGGAQYVNDFGYARSGGRTHKGNDLFGAEGTPLLAVDDGQLRFGTDTFGGTVATVTSSDNTRYYYAHLSRYEGSAPRAVQAGDVIGYLGKSGNAETTAPHLHFEVHPGANYLNAVNPYPMLVDAPVVSASESGGGSGRRISPVVAVLVAGAVGAGIWAYMNPVQARRLVRSF